MVGPLPPPCYGMYHKKLQPFFGVTPNAEVVKKIFKKPTEEIRMSGLREIQFWTSGRVLKTKSKFIQSIFVVLFLNHIVPFKYVICMFV